MDFIGLIIIKTYIFSLRKSSKENKLNSKQKNSQLKSISSGWKMKQLIIFSVNRFTGGITGSQSYYRYSCQHYFDNIFQAKSRFHFKNFLNNLRNSKRAGKDVLQFWLNNFQRYVSLSARFNPHLTRIKLSFDPNSGHKS